MQVIEKFKKFIKKDLLFEDPGSISQKVYKFMEPHLGKTISSYELHYSQDEVNININLVDKNYSFTLF